MRDIAKLDDLFREKGLELTGPVIVGIEPDAVHLVFVRAGLDKEGRRSPSAYVLNTTSAAAAAIGFKLNFILVDGERSDLDSSLKTMLFGKFSDMIRNSYGAFANNRANVWVEPKRVITEEEKQKIESAVREFLTLLNYELELLNITQSENLPTPTAILRALRTLAPCTLQTLTEELVRRGFVVPNEAWMNHGLDRLRKAGVIFRKRNGEYFLSLSGLSSQGTQKNRQSPDIIRSLALARKET